MIGLFGCFVALIATYMAGRQSLGRGISALMTVGYFYGIFRAQFPDGASHFAFDAALLGLYWAQFNARGARGARASKSVKHWFTVLAIWPFLVIMISPFLDAQHVLIQLVGLRAAVLMVPMVVLGSRARTEDVDQFGRTLAWLNLAALFLAVLEYRYGVDRFVPENEVTRIVFMSSDVGEEGALRIPSFFTTAHAYGGTMFLSFPYVLHDFLRARRLRRSVTVPLAALGATLIGVFICGARTPVALTGFTLAVVVLTTKLPPRAYGALAVLGAGVGLVVSTEERFQRFATLRDTQMVRERIANTGNVSFIDTLLQHPLGAGLASASGTSIPFFLRDLARPQMYFENEFGRLLLEQGLPGLLMWICFAAWVLLRGWKPAVLPVVTHRFMWATTLVMWAMSFIGTGMFTAIPGTVFLMLQMGVLVAAESPEHAVAAAAERAPAQPVRPVRALPRPLPRR